jgi:hypothetical protein
MMGALPLSSRVFQRVMQKARQWEQSKRIRNDAEGAFVKIKGFGQQTNCEEN